MANPNVLKFHLNNKNQTYDTHKKLKVDYIYIYIWST
jgi:hypothetical protein